MDKLEQYLDQVCKGIGGPVEMRRHVRQELREHLLDAIAQHKAAGLSDDAAIQKALKEFGKPDEVRTELEAAHGQRMTWIIDKAMQWKEMTMKAKWLWVSWAYLGLVLVIALNVLFITFNNVMIFPKIQKLMYEGIIDLGDADDDGVSWMVNFLHNLHHIGGHYTTFILIGAIVAVALFEWRVKSENKPFIRCAALGTIAVGLTVIVALMAGGMVIILCVGAPAMGRIARPWAVDQVNAVESSANALEQALAKKEHGDMEWTDMQEQVDNASAAVTRLTVRVASTSLTKPAEPPTVEELHQHVKTSLAIIPELRKAVTARDAERARTELARFRRAFDPVRAAAKRQQK